MQRVLIFMDLFSAHAIQGLKETGQSVLVRSEKIGILVYFAVWCFFDRFCFCLFFCCCCVCFFLHFSWNLKAYICKKWKILKMHSVKHNLNFFLFYRKLMFRSWDFNFSNLNYSINFKIFDVMMIISTGDRVHFWTDLLYCKSLGHETWLATRFCHWY